MIHPNKRYLNEYVTDPGIGPSLSYVTEPPLTLVQCRVQQVYPEPRLELSVYSEQIGPGYLGLRSVVLLRSLIIIVLGKCTFS